VETRLLIGGERPAGDGPVLAVENPATEEVVAEVGSASPEQVDAAIAAAREAQRGWANMPAGERGELLHEVARRLREQTDELARVMTLEGGKPLIENSDEVGWTAAAFDYYAEMGRNFAGRVIPPGPDDPIKSRWLGIFDGAGIHGTAEVGSLGSAASHGCIRMAIPDVEALFDQVEVGDPVFIA
jgi:acyl-CoA reductase-like NAD-dependent aldehyde dehydrogenase